MLFEKVALDTEIRKYINIASVVAIIFYLATFVVPYNGQVYRFSVILLFIYLFVIIIVEIRNHDFNAKWFIYIQATYGLEDRCSLTKGNFEDFAGNRDKEEVNFGSTIYMTDDFKNELNVPVPPNVLELCCFEWY